jgi:hypothetical protein
LRAIELRAKGEGVHTQATAAHHAPLTMDLPQTATKHLAAEAQPYRFTLNSFQAEVRRFLKGSRQFIDFSICIFDSYIFHEIWIFFAFLIIHKTASLISSRKYKTST